MIGALLITSDCITHVQCIHPGSDMQYNISKVDTFEIGNFENIGSALTGSWRGRGREGGRKEGRKRKRERERERRERKEKQMKVGRS